MPTPTDLVTDLPADFEVFGQAVDTDFADLLGGANGYILSKASATDLDFAWIPNDQGDITAVNVTSPITGGGSAGAVTIGINAATTSVIGAVQLSDSTSTTSSVLASTPTATKSAYDLAAAAVPKSTVTTAGDIIYRNATVPTRLGIGTAGQVLTVNSGATAPQWSTPSSSSITSQTANLGSNVTITNANTFYDGVTISLAAGTWLLIGTMYVDDASSTGGTVTAKLWDGTTVTSSGEVYPVTSGAQIFITLSGIVSPTTTTTYKMSAATSQNIHIIKAAAVQNGAGNNANQINAIKIA